MAARRPLVLVLAAILPSMGASYRTPNFVVEAPTPEIARQVGQYAEHYRREKAVQWLGREMAPWPQPCPVRVTVTGQGAGGATSFVYEQGQVLGQEMHIEGPLDRLLASVLPHEVTHTVFAYYFRQPVPRWADEGGSVLSEDEPERNRHDQLVRQVLADPRRAIPLRRLFAMREYPRDVMSLYAEGYSVSNYLTSLNGRPAFLAFVAQGMRDGWDHALRAHYGFNSVEDLEQAWVDQLRNPRRPPAAVLANAKGPVEADPAGRVTVRLTAPPVQPLADTPARIYRGQSPDPEPPALGWNQPPRGLAGGRADSFDPYPQVRVQVMPAPVEAPCPVRLGPPQPWQPAADAPIIVPGPPCVVGRP